MRTLTKKRNAHATPKVFEHIFGDTVRDIIVLQYKLTIIPRIRLHQSLSHDVQYFSRGEQIA